jgi:holo-[acyl-carrier protein] synthase
MIFGIGTDIVSVARMAEFRRRHGERALERVLAPQERERCLANAHPDRFLAKRFAAKEALAKALGTGIRSPVTFTAIAVVNDELGKPCFEFGAELAAFIDERGLTAHLSISDEHDYAVAFVVMERQ